MATPRLNADGTVEATSCGVETSPCSVAVATYQPTYKPTYKPSLRGATTRRRPPLASDAGDKGPGVRPHPEAAKVERCRGVGEDGVPALKQRSTAGARCTVRRPGW